MIINDGEAEPEGSDGERAGLLSAPSSLRSVAVRFLGSHQ